MNNVRLVGPFSLKPVNAYDRRQMGEERSEPPTFALAGALGYGGFHSERITCSRPRVTYRGRGHGIALGYVTHGEGRHFDSALFRLAPFDWAHDLRQDLRQRVPFRLNYPLITTHYSLRPPG